MEFSATGFHQPTEGWRMLSHFRSAALQLLAMAASTASMRAKPCSLHTQAMSEAHFPFKNPATMPNAAPCYELFSHLYSCASMGRWSSRTAHCGNWASAGATGPRPDGGPICPPPGAPGKAPGNDMMVFSQIFRCRSPFSRRRTGKKVGCHEESKMKVVMIARMQDVNEAQKCEVQTRGEHAALRGMHRLKGFRKGKRPEWSW